jgi:NADH dehydrogenase
MFGPDDTFLNTILTLLRRLPVYPMFGRGQTRLQPAYVEDVAEAVARLMARAETHPTVFEFCGPTPYSYEQLLRAVAHQAGLGPRLIPTPFVVWHALAWVSEILPDAPLTRNQVELMQIDTVSSPGMAGFAELGISPHPIEEIPQRMLSNRR